MASNLRKLTDTLVSPTTVLAATGRNLLNCGSTADPAVQQVTARGGEHSRDK